MTLFIFKCLLLALAASLVVVAVDIVSRGPERREIRRWRREVRRGIFVSKGLPVIRAMPRRKPK